MSAQPSPWWAVPRARVRASSPAAVCAANHRPCSRLGRDRLSWKFHDRSAAATVAESRASGCSPRETPHRVSPAAAFPRLADELEIPMITRSVSR